LPNTLGLPEMVVIALIALCTVLPASLICGKAGYPRWLGGLAIVPLLNVILAFFLAFAEWPVERELKEARLGQRNAS
jgi:hypothetical protein